MTFFNMVSRQSVVMGNMHHDVVFMSCSLISPLQAPECVWCTSAAVGGGCYSVDEVRDRKSGNIMLITITGSPSTGTVRHSLKFHELYFILTKPCPSSQAKLLPSAIFKCKTAPALSS